MERNAQKAAETMIRVFDRAKENFVGGILGHTPDGMVGFALIAPDCVLMVYCIAPMPVADAFFDFCLN